ncbi:hypothetical protein Fmac_018935 [Flemingia macrophylla]|uniref:Apple domain-containing protein n=1 Tax=Flemingia macrophylla TaxID=520843 RepID=A0ABD1M6F3_9FABA
MASSSSLLTLFIFSLFTIIAQATVPQNETFKFVNSGELGPYLVEYDANYRMIDIFNKPFQVAFYNTPNAFTLALRMGLQRSEQLFHWTNTSNKGVVAFRLLPNGNMVLLDAQDGPYSLVLEPKGLALYYKSNNSPRPILYWFSSDWFYIPKGSLQNVTLTSDSEIFDIGFDYHVANSPYTGGNRIIGRPVNNGTLTYLSLGIDGNIRMHTYFLDVRENVWQVTYTLFDRDSYDESECQLPERCGKFGLCEDNQCVACPLENGIFVWRKNCTSKAVTSCKASEFHYYTVEGVEHCMSKYTTGSRVSESNCGNKCTKDCKCVGYFYHRENSRCWIAHDLQTLTRVANSSHVGYIKVPN